MVDFTAISWLACGASHEVKGLTEATNSQLRRGGGLLELTTQDSMTSHRYSYILQIVQYTIQSYTTQNSKCTFS